MRIRFKAVAIAALAAAFLAPQSQAQTSTSTEAPEIEVFKRRIKPSQSLERFLSQIATDFRQLGSGGDTLSQADVELQNAIWAASIRAALLSQIAASDLDGDGYVSRDEVVRMLRYQRRTTTNAVDGRESSAFERKVARVMARDGDGDGRISMQEALKIPADSAEGQFFDRGAGKDTERLKQALLLDTDGDGVITLAEFQAAGEIAFAAADADGSMEISAEEAERFRQFPPTITDAMRRRSREVAQARAEEAEQAVAAAKAAEDAICAMPKASPEAQVILGGVYEAQSISNVAIGTQDETVTTASLVVEPGDTPLYVVVASYDPIIWRVSGAVERIERLVLGSFASLKAADGKPTTTLVGATGISAERVTFLSPPNCLEHFTESPSTASAKAAAVVRAKAGRDPQAVFAAYSVDSFVVPSGKMTSLREQFAGDWPLIVTPSGALRIIGEGGSATVLPQSTDVASELARFSPGGVVAIDPTTVVASAPVEPYIVLPQQAGLLQLIEEGALTKNNSGEFLIHRKMRFPPGLHGAHSVTFLLLRDVPMPDGDPGHSTVVSEATGEILAGPFRR